MSFTPKKKVVRYSKNVNKLQKLNFLIIISIIVAILVSVILIFPTLQQKPTEGTKSGVQQTNEIKFQKNGELNFRTSRGKVLATIDIEIAETESKHVLGLMYRDSLAENQGMLFIFPEEEERSFWMRNCRFGLDIIYIDAKGVIVKIQSNASPFTERSIVSEKPAKFVVEVVAGFTSKYKINEGDKIQWKRMEN